MGSVTTTATGIILEPDLYDLLADLSHTNWLLTEAQPELALFATLTETQPITLTSPPLSTIP